MEEEVKQPYSGTTNEDFEKIQEWLYMCLSKWYWFVISLVIALGLAMLYLLVATPSYTRKASVLIKDDEKSSTLSSEFSMFSDMGFQIGKTNIYNETCRARSLEALSTLVRYTCYAHGMLPHNNQNTDAMPFQHLVSVASIPKKSG